MTLLEALMRAVGPAPDLDVLLIRAGNTAPDIKPELDEWRSRLNEAVSADNLSALAGVLRDEITAIASGHINPRRSPSNTI